MGAGGGPKSALTVKMRCVFSSNSIVRAPRLVGTVATTVYLSGESSWTTLTVPSPPFALKANPVSGSKAAASVPGPIGTVVTTFPSFAFTTAINLLEQTEKILSCFRSMASPDGSEQGASDDRRVTVSLFESISTSSLVSSIFTNTRPFSSATANSGRPASATVPATIPVFASIAVASLLDPLNAKTRFEAGS